MQPKTITIQNQLYHYYALNDLASKECLQKLPYSLKILLENVYRNSHTQHIRDEITRSIIASVKTQTKQDIPFYPARVLMQDFTGVPAIVDLAALRDAALAKGADPKKINPLIPVDLIIDHSVTVEQFASPEAFEQNVKREYQQNLERYQFLKWGRSAFQNFRVVPPGTGICHQVNLEYLAQVVWQKPQTNGETLLYPDTLVGTDSHTPMVNGLSVLGWGVGGIEAEAAMLGQPLSLLIPQVVGVKLTEKLSDFCIATDLVLTITQLLRQKGVVGKFVEFYGEGLDHLSLPDRATLANMAPEYGATCAFFPTDQETINYLRFTGRSEKQIAIVETYCKAQGLWRDPDNTPHFHDCLELNLNDIEPSLAGPKRPQDRISLAKVSLTAKQFSLPDLPIPVENKSYSLKNHDVVIAAITSCTNTSNPVAMVGAGLLARKAKALGLDVKPWIKTSFAPGSKVVTDYLEQAGLMSDLEALGFYLVGYGCTTCIGNSGPLNPDITKVIEANNLTVSSVLSGNRNFEGRIHPYVKANYLASPLLVIAYALAGTTLIDLTTESLGEDQNGQSIFLKDIWPTPQEIEAILKKFLTPEMFKKQYANVFEGEKNWQEISNFNSLTYPWDKHSTYIKRPPFLENVSPIVETIKNAHILGIFGDSITTDHISPAGNIRPNSPAGQYLSDRGVAVSDFNSYGSRRGHDEIMVRGTFANIRLQNEMVPNKTGGYTLCDGEIVTIFESAMRYKEKNTPLVIIAGKEYGAGSSRDWAAKGTSLLGVKAVLAETFERIHRSNLIGMGILPLEFKTGVTRHSLSLTGDETLTLCDIDKLKVGGEVKAVINTLEGSQQSVWLRCRIDTEEELNYFNQGGILPYILKQMTN